MTPGRATTDGLQNRQSAEQRSHDVLLGLAPPPPVHFRLPLDVRQKPISKDIFSVERAVSSHYKIPSRFRMSLMRSTKTASRTHDNTSDDDSRNAVPLLA